MAEAILKRYPDYGKVTPEYFAGITEALAIYPRHISHRIADIAEGITAICKFPPSVAEIVEMGNRMVDVERHRADTAKRYAHIRAEPEPLAAFTPFPKLSEAFAAEPHLLKHERMNFDILYDASKALAAHGFEAARAVLISNSPKVMVTKHDGPVTERSMGSGKFITGVPFPEHLMNIGREFDHDT